MTRGKPRRPASRQVRLNQRVKGLRGIDSESHREMGELGECEPPSQTKINLMKIQKVIPDHVNNKSMHEDASHLNNESKESSEYLIERK